MLNAFGILLLQIYLFPDPTGTLWGGGATWWPIGVLVLPRMIRLLQIALIQPDRDGEDLVLTLTRGFFRGATWRPGTGSRSSSGALPKFHLKI